VNSSTGEELPPQLLKACESRLERPLPEFPPTVRQLLRILCSDRDRPSTWAYRAPKPINLLMRSSTCQPYTA